MQSNVKTSDALAGVKYKIRGDQARRAFELERLGYEITSLQRSFSHHNAAGAGRDS